MATATYSTTINRVLSELNKAGSFTAEAGLAINSALSFYKTRPFWFTEEIANSNTAADTEWYELPSDFESVITMSITVNSSDYSLNERHYSMLEGWSSSDNTSSRPTDFSIYRRQLRLYPIPDDTYTLRLSYHRGGPELSADADTHVLLIYAEELVRRRAQKDMCISVLEDTNRAQMFAALEVEAYERILKDSTARTLTGHTKRRC